MAVLLVHNPLCIGGQGEGANEDRPEKGQKRAMLKNSWMRQGRKRWGGGLGQDSKEA